MAKQTNKMNNPKTAKQNFQKSAEKTKEILKAEINKECLAEIVSKKCFDRYFKYDEEKCTLTPKNNPPLQLFPGFINYILISYRLRGYREKELGIHQSNYTHYVSLIYNKLSSYNFDDFITEENLIKEEIRKLQYIERELTRRTRNKIAIIYNLFSEEEIIEKIKDVIFEDKTTRKISGKIYNRNRKSECDFLVALFYECVKLYRLDDYLIHNEHIISTLSNKNFNNHCFDIRCFYSFFAYSHTIPMGCSLFKQITGNGNFGLIEACSKLDYAKKKVVFDMKKFVKLKKERKRAKNVKLPD